MVILHFVESLNRGGLERVVVDLAVSQWKSGHDARICCLFSKGSLAEELTDRGIPVTSLQKKPGPDLRAVLSLASLIRRARVDILHSHNQVPNYYASAARLVCLRPIHLVTTRHNMGSLDSTDRRGKLFRLSVRLTDRVAFVSQAARNQFITSSVVPEWKSDVVLNSIPIERHIPCTPGSNATAKNLLGFSRGHLIVGAVGRLVSEKNHRGLIEAMAPLFAETPSLHLVIIGSGPLRMDLETQAKTLGVSDRVHLLGERSDVHEVLPAFDVFAMPSETEGHSIALLEAMASGLAVVATNVGGNPEIVTDGATGRLVSYGDCAALRQALRLLLQEVPERERFQQAAREWALREISLENMVARYNDFYGKALSA